ncbi:MAG: triose-phosphate isomerase [Elusimicrobiota bacterium]
MRKPIIAGNWKMYKNEDEAVELVEKLKKNLSDVYHCEIVVCPPFVSLDAVRNVIKDSNVKLGAQNLFWEEKGAYTGEVSPAMLISAGCKYVIVGHSERRQYFLETDETVNKKMHSAFKSGLIPIVCIGETLAERESGITIEVIERQIKKGLAGLNVQQSGNLVIAYEPVWAIGTGKTATPQQAQEVQAEIRKIYSGMYGSISGDSVRILYGGSVKPDNISSLMHQPDIDGALVGGASLEADSFVKIVKYK